MPRLDMAVDETLRLYPPAWIGPRLALEPFEVAGTRVAGGTYVNYCSWASHRLPDVFPDPHRSTPSGSRPSARPPCRRAPTCPFGGGSRTCIGMRFGQMEVKAVATLALQRFRLELLPGARMTVRQMPTLSPRGRPGHDRARPLTATSRRYTLTDQSIWRSWGGACAQQPFSSTRPRTRTATSRPRTG